MKAYIITTGVVFGLLTLAHLLRIDAEVETQLAKIAKLMRIDLKHISTSFDRCTKWIWKTTIPGTATLR